MNSNSTSTTTPNPRPFDNPMSIFTHEDATAWEGSVPSQVPIMVPQAGLAPNVESSADRTFGHNLEHYREGETAHHSSWTDDLLSSSNLNDISSTGFQSQINYQVFDWQNNHFVGQWSDSGPMDSVDGEGYQIHCEDYASEPHTPMTVMTDHDNFETGGDNAQQSWLMQNTAQRYYPTLTNELYADWQHDSNSQSTTRINASASSVQQQASMIDDHRIRNIPTNHSEVRSHDTTDPICVVEKATNAQTRISNQRYDRLDAQSISGSDPWTVNQEQYSDFERSPEVGRSETPRENEFTFPTTVSEGGVGMSTPGTSAVRKASSSSLPRRNPHPAGIRKQKTKNTASEKTRWYTNREGKVIPVSRGYRSDLVP